MAAVLLYSAHPAFAQEQERQGGVISGNPPSISGEGIRGQPEQQAPFEDRLTGDWGGLRARLRARGLSIVSTYTSETAANPFGSSAKGVRYTQQLSLGAQVEMGALAGIDGGHFTVNLVRRDGRDLAPVIGSLRSPQELYGAGQNLRLSELSYRQRLFAGSIELAVGHEALGNDFANSNLYCYFQSGMFCGHNPALASNSGWINNPTGQWGARARLQRASTYAQVGIYQVDPAKSGKTQGFDLGFGGTGVIVPAEIGWVPDRGLLGLPGRFKFGVYYDTSDTPDVLRDVNGQNAGLTRLARRKVGGRYGAWLQADQLLVRPAGYDDTTHGLAMFASLALGDRNTAQYDYAWNVGLVQMGLSHRRPDDYVSIAIGIVHVNKDIARLQAAQNLSSLDRVGIQSRELAVEVNYGAQVTRWFQLRPGLQYIQRPGGVRGVPDAFVTAVTLAVDL